MKKNILISLLFLSACGSSVESQSVSTKNLLTLTSFFPANGTIIDNFEFIEFEFSHPVKLDSLNETNLFLIPLKDHLIENIKSDAAKDLLNDINDLKVKVIQGTTECDDAQVKCRWNSKNQLEPFQAYAFIISSKTQSQERFPFFEKNSEIKPHFMSIFTIKGVKPNQNSKKNIENDQKLESPRPQTLLINELLYDADGSETDGQIFIELYGTPSSNISSYQIRFVNGSNVETTTEIIFDNNTFLPDDGFLVIADAKIDDDNETFVPNADIILQFDPQNGPDSVQLLDETGAVLDVLGYGEGMIPQDNDNRNLFEFSPAVDVGRGLSLSRENFIDTQNNRSDFFINLNPSPGLPDLVKDEIEFEDLNPDNQNLDEQLLDFDDQEPNQENPNNPQLIREDPLILQGVHFSEIVTDPQKDWNDSSGGNGIPFDEFFGDGAIGFTDEWVEIKNGSQEAVDMSQWFVNFIDGTDETVFFNDDSVDFIFSNEGSVDFFMAGERLVIPNPPGHMSNEIRLQLYDSNEDLVHEVYLEDGDSEGVEDESYQLSDDGFWLMGESTFLF